MSKLDKLEKFNFMPDAEETVRNNRNLSEMFRGVASDYAYLPLSSISFNPDNDYASSDNETDIRNLAEDIRRNGLLHNVVVSLVAPGQYKLLSGERRVRAYQYLADSTGEDKYRSIYALIKKNLTRRQELIILDAANLQTRGSVTEEKKFRKSGIRFIENLKQEFSVSDREAVSLTKDFADVKERTIDRNLTLERELDKTLLSFLDNGDLPKNDALVFASASPNFQKKAADVLLDAKKVPDKQAFLQISHLLLSHAKRDHELSESIAGRTEALRRLRLDLVSCPPELTKTLRAQEAEMQSLIDDMQAKADENFAALDSLYFKEKRSPDSASPSESVSNLMLSVKHLETDASRMQKQFRPRTVRFLNEEEKEQLQARLFAVRQWINDTIRILSDPKD